MNNLLYYSLFVLLIINFHVEALNLQTLPYTKSFAPLFGESNIIQSPDDQFVQLHLNQYTGSGFKSLDLYNHGLFSAKIKLPSNYTAGVVVAFYTTNGDVFKKSHDELDFEFLGNIPGKSWRFQTNMYGNGSTSRGREERYFLPFDPSQDFHKYSILWTNQIIIFYIDDVPIREIVRNDAMGADFPSKPMSLYATIWDASDWATSGGKYRANYKYAPFVTEFTDLVLHGCAMDPLEEVVATADCTEKDNEVANADFARITRRQKLAMTRFRSKYMYYSYCYDKLRYNVPLPECVIDPVLRQRFKDTGRPKFGLKHQNRRFKKRSQVMENSKYGNQDEV